MSFFSKSPETIKAAQPRFSAALRERNWSIEHVAAFIGMSADVVRSSLKGYQVNRHCRRRCELVIGPIWSTPEEWHAINTAAERLGVDPILTPRITVIKQARLLGLSGAARPASIQDIIAEAAALPPWKSVLPPWKRKSDAPSTGPTAADFDALPGMKEAAAILSAAQPAISQQIATYKAALKKEGIPLLPPVGKHELDTGEAAADGALQPSDTAAGS